MQPNQGSLDALWLQIDSVFSEVIKVVEDAKQKSHNLPLSTLRTTTLTMMEQIHQKLDKMSSIGESRNLAVIAFQLFVLLLWD